MSDVTHEPSSGLRVSRQPESERLEAAEFLIATRIQEDARRRIMRAARQQPQPAPEPPEPAAEERAD